MSDDDIVARQQSLELYLESAEDRSDESIDYESDEDNIKRENNMQLYKFSY